MVLDFLQDWDIGTIILAAAVLTVVVLAGSFAIALAWRKWKEQQRARKYRAAGGTPPSAPTGVGFGKRAIVTKLPKLGSQGQAKQPGKRALPKLGLPKLAPPKLRRKG